MAIDFPRSTYTAAEGNSINGWSSSPSNGDTATANGDTFTYNSSKSLWILNTGRTLTLSGGTTYSWDGEKWIAQSHIPFRYHGPLSSDPTGMTSDDVGDLYFNTTSDTLKVYTGSAWEDYSIPDDGAITPAKLSTGGPYWNTSSNVGIGTTNPQRKLSIYNPNSGTSYAQFVNSTTGASTNDGFLVGLSSDEGAAVWMMEDSYLRFGTNNTERMRITNNGSVGIGTSTPAGVTANSEDTLHIDGLNATLRIGRFFSVDDRDNILLHADDTDSYIRSNNERFHIYNKTGDTVFHGLSDAERMRITSSGNVGIGISSPTEMLEVAGDATINAVHVGKGAGGAASQNTRVGLNALSDSSPGSWNTAIGYEAMLSATSSSAGNVGIGRLALQSNTTGTNNTAIGSTALQNNVIGIGNTAVGGNALKGTTGSRNTAIGAFALHDNNSSGSTAVGHSAMKESPSGFENTAVGWEALYETSGVRNSALGSNALKSLTTGNNNTAIGQNSLKSLTTGSSNVAIGNTTGSDIITGNNNTILGRGQPPGDISDTICISAGHTERVRVDSTGTFLFGGTLPGSPTTEITTTGEATFDQQVQVGTNRKIEEKIEYYIDGTNRLNPNWFIQRDWIKTSAVPGGASPQCEINFYSSPGSIDIIHKVRVSQNQTPNSAYYEFLVVEDIPQNNQVVIAKDIVDWNKGNFTIAINGYDMTITAGAATFDHNLMNVEVETLHMGQNLPVITMSSV